MTLVGARGIDWSRLPLGTQDQREIRMWSAVFAVVPVSLLAALLVGEALVTVVVVYYLTEAIRSGRGAHDPEDGGPR